MLRTYTQRYIAIDKCHLIKPLETCKVCGWELTSTHETDFSEERVVERITCAHCGKTLDILAHELH